MTKIKIKQPNGEVRLIGYLEDDQILYCYRRGTRHIYRKYNAWGIDLRVLTSLTGGGLKEIVVCDTETNFNYRASTKTFKEHGIVINHKPHRKQILLPLSYWEREEI